MAQDIRDIRVDDKIRPYVERALDEGWDVTPIANATKLRWRSPDPEVDQIITSTQFGLGHDFRNAVSRLKRAGLVLEETKTNDEEETEMPVSAPPSTVDNVEIALMVLTNYVSEAREKGDWKEIAESHEADLVAAKEQIAKLEEVLNECRMALTTMAPWESMPRLASLLGVNKGDHDGS